MKEAEKIINKINSHVEKNCKFFSYEYFPPKTDMGAVNLINMIGSMGQLNPLFIDITWSAGGKGKNEKTLELVNNTQELCCHTVNMHLTCNYSTREEIIRVLDWCKDRGISNILALRGDPPLDPNWREDEQEFKHAVDLVRLIREVYGDFFCISVAGYPNSHPDCGDGDADIRYLKEKVDAGADFVVSQLFFTAEDYLIWEKKCKDYGITVPILPGILPIQSNASLRNITKMSSVPVPQSIVDAIEPIKENDAAIQEYGVGVAVEMCRKLLESGVPGLHFYTLNREAATTEILCQLQLVKLTRELPWSRSVIGKRGDKEDVRPIYWANRMMSYLSRTLDWSSFPNGRWGDNRNPAFGELTDYHIFLHQKKESPEAMRKIWGESLTSKHDIGAIFVDFLTGKIKKLPWISTAVSLETGLIMDTLINVNTNGFWTINSQPSVNGARSDDLNVGWGPLGGYVYQKAYVEFFASPEDLEIIINKVATNENPHRYNFQAMNRNGDSYSNIERAMAVTWGVFPGQQIIQPTVVDPASFKVWVEEAFLLWQTWKVIYEDEDPSRDVIDEVYNTYYLVTLVDNDFMLNDFFSPVFSYIKANEGK
jgi:methylenetetrahydrofolate reductase (NADPH)